jgi:signal transduction histidine kinase
MKIETPADEVFVLKIGDDGAIFEPNGTNYKGRGIANIRSRASLINAKTAWKKRRTGGNSFSLRIGS